MMDRIIVTDRMVSARESGVKAEIYLCERHPAMSKDSLQTPTRCVFVHARVYTCVPSYACTFLPFVLLHIYIHILHICARLSY